MKRAIIALLILTILFTGCKGKDNTNITVTTDQDCKECPQYMPPGPDFCKEGKIVAGETDKCGCNGPPRCEVVACTDEAKICPDGTSVSRVAPDCEFQPCPT